MSRVEEGRARASGYELLALALSPPSVGVAEAISQAGRSWSLPPLDPTRSSPEYHRLFVGPGNVAVPPYESVYREGGRIIGQTTLDVQKRYGQAGFVLDPALNDLPDHAAAELAFMAVLAEEEAKAWEAGDDRAALVWLQREAAFLGDHLGRWLPAFCDRLLRSTEDPFYRALAASLPQFVALDLEHVRLLTGLLQALPA